MKTGVYQIKDANGNFGRYGVYVDGDRGVGVGATKSGDWSPLGKWAPLDEAHAARLAEYGMADNQTVHNIELVK